MTKEITTFFSPDYEGIFESPEKIKLDAKDTLEEWTSRARVGVSKDNTTSWILEDTGSCIVSTSLFIKNGFAIGSNDYLTYFRRVEISKYLSNIPKDFITSLLERGYNSRFHLCANQNS